MPLPNPINEYSYVISNDRIGLDRSPLATNLLHNPKIIRETKTTIHQFQTTSQTQFEDVPSSEPFFSYVNVLRQWQVTKGCSTIPARYCIGDYVTREQMAMFVIRSIYGDTFAYNPTAYFTDVPSSAPAYTYIQI